MFSVISCCFGRSWLWWWGWNSIFDAATVCVDYRLCKGDLDTYLFSSSCLSFVRVYFDIFIWGNCRGYSCLVRAIRITTVILQSPSHHDPCWKLPGCNFSPARVETENWWSLFLNPTHFHLINKVRQWWATWLLKFGQLYIHRTLRIHNSISHTSTCMIVAEMLACAFEACIGFWFSNLKKGWTNLELPLPRIWTLINL